MVYMGGHVSGAHYNPAVTVALLLSCRSKFGFTWVSVGGYIAAQCVGGILAGLIGYGLTGAANVWSPAPGAPGIGPAFVAEVLYTFALASVVLNVATSKSTANGNAFFGFAIGMTVFVGAVSVGQISGCVLNPAVGTGIILTHALFGGGLKVLAGIWLYWLAPLTGGALAAAVYFVTNPREYCDDDENDGEKV
jgi:aquaporin Z